MATKKSKRPNKPAKPNTEWEKKAAAEWSQLDTSAAVNLKSLMADIKSASAAKTKGLSKTSKKAKANSAKKAQSDKLISAISMMAQSQHNVAEETKRKQAAEAQISLTKTVDALRDSVRLAALSMTLVTKEAVTELKGKAAALRTAIKSAPEGVDKPLLDAAVGDILLEVGKLAAAATDNDKASKERLKNLAKDLSAKKIKDRVAEPTKRSPSNATGAFRAERDKFKSTFGFVGPKKRNSLLQVVDKARSLVSGASDGVSKAKDRLAVGAGTRAARIVNYFQAPTSPVAVKALGNIAKGAFATANAVRDTTKDTFKWLGKRMTLMMGTLARFLKAPFGGSSNGLASLIGLGALAATVIKPMLEGIDAELKRRFGEKYIEDFISGLWSKSWSFLVKQIKGFLGIKEEAPEAKAPEAKAAKVAASEAARKNVVAVQSTVAGSSDSATVVSAKLNAYRSYKDRVTKTRAKTNLQNYLNDEAGPLPTAMVAELEASGFTVSKKSAAPAPATSGRSAPLPPTGAGAGRGGSVGASSPVSSPMESGSGAGRGGSVGASSPVSSPMESGSGAPIVAKPGKSSSEAAPVGPSSGGSGSGGGALGASQIPTFLSSESMHVLNLGVM